MDTHIVFIITIIYFISSISHAPASLLQKDRWFSILLKMDLFKRSAMFIIFLQQIVSNMFLSVVMGKQKINLSCGFKLESTTTYYLWFAVKVLYM